MTPRVAAGFVSALFALTAIAALIVLGSHTVRAVAIASSFFAALAQFAVQGDSVAARTMNSLSTAGAVATLAFAIFLFAQGAAP